MLTTFTIKEVFIPLGNIKIKPKNKSTATSITLREFQEEVIRKLKDHRVLGVSAPTGAGKTFLVLAPLLSNTIYKLQKPFTGVVGIYPTKPLVNDQFLSIISILDKLCLREDELKDPDGRNAYVRYFCHVELEDGVLGLTEEIKTTVGIVRLTSDVLKKLRDTLVKQGYEKKELSANITLL
ncbi:MAG: DEAD/DEAH box helicase, partial [Desulfurococcaceae archaeon]